MTLREITIGRANDCDIFVDPRCKYASSHHAVIYIDGNNLMYRDISKNGTMINNVWVKGRAVPIHQGDMIMLAGHYPLSWGQIANYFPIANPYNTVVLDSYGQGSMGQQSGQYPLNNYSGGQQSMNVANSKEDIERKLNLDKWSWGAFQLYPIWGIFNGCWWSILIWILLTLLCFVPFVNCVVSLFGLGLSITFGINGRRWAWENKKWSSPTSFESAQHSWDTWGLIFFIIGIILLILVIIACFIFGIAIFSELANLNPFE